MLYPIELGALVLAAGGAIPGRAADARLGIIASPGREVNRICGRAAQRGFCYHLPMALVPVTLPDALPAATPAASALIEDAGERIRDFLESRLDEPIHAFVPCDFWLVCRALVHVAASHLAPGNLFCEWGSGAGAVTCLAALAGFDARGIEFEADLVDLARALAADHGVEAEFVRGNFVPNAGQRIAEEVSEFEWLAVGGQEAYAAMGMDVDDFDVIFAYPWPGEEQVVLRLFDRFAADGALLMTYNGEAEGMKLFRRRSERAL
jgi:precorrin-6B methylase 2